MDFNNIKLEVIINYDNETYTASSPLFPECSGNAKTKRNALSKLSTAISNHIKKYLTKNLNQVLLSKNYKSIIINPKEKQNEHRIYKILPDQSQEINPILELKEITEKTITQKNTLENEEVHQINFNISLN